MSWYVLFLLLFVSLRIIIISFSFSFLILLSYLLFPIFIFIIRLDYIWVLTHGHSTYSLDSCFPLRSGFFIVFPSMDTLDTLWLHDSPVSCFTRCLGSGPITLLYKTRLDYVDSSLACSWSILAAITQRSPFLWLWLDLGLFCLFCLVVPRQ